MTEIILGPPGTGKTTTLLREVERELKGGTRPDHIAYVSFTKRAAHEAISRACEKFSLTHDDLPYFRTLHSLCFRTLGMQRGDVFEGKVVQEWAKYAGVQVTGYWSDDGTLTGYADGDRVMFIENMARVRCVSLREQYLEDPDNAFTWTFLDTAVEGLRKFKETNALLDYTDMLTAFCQSNIQIPLKMLVVDEAQDLSALQWRVIKKLAANAERVVVAGDDDQAIYVWAGADVNELVTMAGSVNVLGQSWRVPKSIQKVANGLSGMIHRRRPKNWRAREGDDGAVENAYTIDEVDLGGDDIMVLARNVFVQRQVELSLRRRGIVYENKYGSSVKKSYLQAVTSWEKLRAGEPVTVEEARGVYGLMSSGVGYKRGFKTLPGMLDDTYVMMSYLKKEGGLLVDSIWHEALDKIPSEDKAYMLAARRHGEKFNARSRVRVSTIHTAKGAEAKHVVLMLEVARRTDREAELKPDDELRVWYVAVTRAKERLTLVEPQQLNSFRCKWL